MSGLSNINTKDILGNPKIGKSTKSGKTENNTPIINPGEESNKDLFLKMLVAQMQNQDPFNPQDPTQYVTQLSQFTMLEQTMTLNDNMEYMLGMTSGLLTNSAMSAATSLIGKEVEMYDTRKDESSDDGSIDVDVDPTEPTDPSEKTVTGIVEGVHIKDGIVYVDMKDKATGENISIEYSALIKINNTNNEVKGE